MEIEFNRNGASLTAKPVGRLDTATSPELARDLKPEMEGVTALTLDMERVDYVSSAGLRVLLTLQQDMDNCGGTLQLVNVNEYIREIFEMTGFSGMIDIR